MVVERSAGGSALTVAGEPLWLHASGAAYLPTHQTWLLADVHLGKGASFRRAGLPVPQGSSADTLRQIEALLALAPAKRVVFLGDFVHAATSHGQALWDLVAALRARHGGSGAEWLLIRGNHDRGAGDPPSAVGLRCVDGPWRLGAFALCHEPEPVAGAYVLAGHWHPCVRLQGPAHERLRLPCFWFGDEQRHPVGVLPAFGRFTGMHPIERRPGDRVHAIAGDAVLAVPEAGPAARRGR